MTPGLPHNLCPYKVMLFVFSGLRKRGGVRETFWKVIFIEKKFFPLKPGQPTPPLTHPHTRLFIPLVLQPLDQEQLGPYVRHLITLHSLYFFLRGVNAEKSKPEPGLNGVGSQSSCLN